MTKKNSIGLVMATELEAKPLISDYGFAVSGNTPYPTYVNDPVVMVISGIGKAHAAAATAWMMTTFTPEWVLNAGAAGATGNACSLGDMFQIDTVFEADRPRLDGEGIESFSLAGVDGLPTMTLATQDHVISSAKERRRLGQFAGLVDMEGAAVVGTCRQFCVPVSLIKFVSDIHDGHNIAENIVRLREDFCERLYHWLADPGLCMGVESRAG